MTIFLDETYSDHGRELMYAIKVDLQEAEAKLLTRAEAKELKKQMVHNGTVKVEMTVNQFDPSIFTRSYQWRR